MFAERLSPFPVRVLLMVIPQWRIVAASRRHPGDAPLMIADRGVSSTVVHVRPRKV